MDGDISDIALQRLIGLKSNFSSSKNNIILDFDTTQRVLKKRFSNRNMVFNGAKSDYIQIAEQKHPKISVIVPTYNRVGMLRRCIDSILSQNYSDIEIVIVDDGSTDGTFDIVKKEYSEKTNIVYHYNEKNLGPGGSRQKGYQIATGQYIVFADDDDFYIEPQFFLNAIALFLENHSLAMVCANSVIYDLTKEELIFQPLNFCGMMDKEQFFLGFGQKYKKPNSTFPTMLKKSTLDLAGFGEMWMMNDTSIYLRAACFGSVCMLKDWVGVYTVHNSNISKSLPHKFILDNLDEKRNIYQIACKQINSSLTKWYHTQLMITIRYYLHSDRIGLKKFLSLLVWIIRHGEKAKVALLHDTIKCQYEAYKNEVI